MRKIAFFTFFCSLVILFLAACSDKYDSFSDSPSNHVSIPSDTISLDTVFTTIGSSTKSFWVYNKSGDGIRLSEVCLENGAQSGFRVNVDGTYLGAETGYKAFDIEIRHDDSIQVFVEITAPVNRDSYLHTVSDKLYFRGTSGVEDKVVLTASTINANKLKDFVVTKDTTLCSDLPYIVYGGITVAKGSTLTIGAGTALCFHGNTGMDVFGTLLVKGDTTDVVTFRGDRIDRMFDYLPYDRIPGQWDGIHFYESSYGNEIYNADIHAATNAVVCDSSDISRHKLYMENVIVHNNMGVGVSFTNCFADLRNCQITNAAENCLYVCGGDVTLNSCTIAQFYSLTASGYALEFTNHNGNISYPLQNMQVHNSIITGVKDDEVLGEADSLTTFAYYFADCLMKTPKMESKALERIVFESNDSTVNSEMNFIKINHDSLIYDFRLDTLSKAINIGNPNTVMPYDLLGKKRKATPSLGAYEWFKKK